MLTAIFRGICATSLACGVSLSNASIRSGADFPIRLDRGHGTRSALAGCEGFECMRRYMELPDESFTWQDTGLRLKGPAPETGVMCTLHVLHMTSQTWLKGISSLPTWNHHLVLVEPSNLASDDAKSNWTNLVIGDTLTVPVHLLAVQPDKDMAVAMGLAARLGTRSAVVYNVPNEWNSFRDDPLRVPALEQEFEKSYTWMHVIRHPDRPEFMIELPNLRATVRAMDALQNYTSALPTGRASDFALSGFSKRGVAAWMTAAFDSRVKALLPGAITLRLREMLKNTVRSYGHAPVIALSYFMRDVFGSLDEPGAHLLFKTIDASNYLERLTMPKFLMVTTSDDYMLPDATRGWWGRLPGENGLLMKPNRGHLTQMSEADFLPPAAAFLQGVITGQPAPRVVWNISESDGSITARVDSAHTPSNVRLWSARTCKAHRGRRDFRLLSLDSRETCSHCGIPLPVGCWNMVNTWSMVDLDPDTPGGRTWAVRRDAPADSTYLGFYLEFVFQGPDASSQEPWQFTTEVSILPMSWPRKECFGQACMGDYITLA